uniref:Rhodanese domain-containing protein n=1 Tax=Alexandrium monilatum TaxID=311494 RepID=A0A7S4W3K2_9DINO
MATGSPAGWAAAGPCGRLRRSGGVVRRRPILAGKRCSPARRRLAALRRRLGPRARPAPAHAPPVLAPAAAGKRGAVPPVEQPPGKRRRTEGSGGDRHAAPSGKRKGGITIVLFYQYKEPPWSPEEYKAMMAWAEQKGRRHGLGGRMRIAREGFNCTLTGRPGSPGVRGWCRELQKEFPDPFAETEFKFTDGLEPRLAWNDLQVVPADEIVGYGLGGELAPSLSKGGTHLEPKDFHAKLAEPNTVVVDIRNSYEVDIGRFVPPPGTEFINPKMRRSTDLPAWLSRSDVQERLQGKNVMMYCTGGIRCERASSLLKHQMGDQVQEVFQLQGGIDKYLKEYKQDGGYWAGQNYVFDKRFYHGAAEKPATEVLGSCISCHRQWDDYRASVRCNTCGVPVLVCDACAEVLKKDSSGQGLQSARCQLCIRERVTSKAEFRSRELHRNAEASKGVYRLLHDVKEIGIRGAAPAEPALPASEGVAACEAAANPTGITRLFIGNLSAKRVDEATLLKAFPGITHIQWLKDKASGLWYGSVFVEMASAEEAAMAVARDGEEVALRPARVKFSPMQGPGRWPPLGTAVGTSQKPPTAADAAKAKGRGEVTPMSPKPFPKCRKFFVRGVAPEVADRDVHKFFGACKIIAIRWMTNKETGAFRGCGHVEFATTKDAETASALHGKKLLGRPLRLDWAV